MNCNECRRFLEADADGELDLGRHLEIAEHLRGCAECARRADTIRAGRAARREKLPRYAATPELAERIRAAIRDENSAAAGAKTESRGQGRLGRAWWAGWPALGAAATLAVAVGGGFVWGGARANGNRLVEDAVAGHVRSLRAGYLTEVASTDQHTVRPWFAGKLEFSPPVIDLAAVGFPLAGGRLEWIGARPVAALVFQRRKHAINLMIWPHRGGVIAEWTSGRDGYNVQAWSQGGFNLVAVSDIPAAELAEFATAWRERIAERAR